MTEIMDEFFVEVDEKAKVTLAVVIAEKALGNLDENEEGYSIARQGLDCCWDWLSEKEDDPDRLCDIASPIDDRKDICFYAFNTKDEKKKIIWNMILCAVAYTANEAYVEEGMAIPGDVEIYDEDIIEPMNDDAIKYGFYEESMINTLMKYLIEKYSYENLLLEVIIKKEDIMKLI